MFDIPIVEEENTKYACYVVIVSAILVIAGTTPAFAMFGKNLEPLVVQLSDDPTVASTASYVRSQIEGCQVIQAFDVATLFAVVKSAYNTIFYVGHGSLDGVKLRSTTLEWQTLEDCARNSPSHQDMVLACYSGNPTLGSGKSWFGFNGQVDSQIGADLLLALYYGTRGNYRTYDMHRHLAWDGITEKMILKTEKPSYLGEIGGGGGGSGPPSYDFCYKDIFWSAYSTDPSSEVYYDHPCYDYYYYFKGYGPANAFTIDPGYGVTAWHYDRASIEIWSGGGLISIAAACYSLGLLAAASIIGIEATPFLLGIGAMLTALGLAAGWIVSVFIKDETGSGWSFCKIINSGDTSDTSAQGGFLKLGCLWWMRITDGYGNAVFTWVTSSDGHYIR